MNNEWWGAFAPFAAWAPTSAPFPPSSGATGATAWAAFASAAERFTTAVQRYATDAPRDPAGAARALGDFLRDQSLEMLRAPWTGGGFGSDAAAFVAPALGPTREHQERAQRAAAAAARAAEAQRRLTLLWSDALRDAAAQFVAALGAASATPPQALELYARWVDAAEQAYAKVAHDEPFAAALAELVNAHARLRDEWQAMIEHWAKPLDLPTRSELDTLGARLRAVEARLHDLEATAAPAAATAHRAPGPEPAPPRPKRAARAAPRAGRRSPP